MSGDSPIQASRERQALAAIRTLRNRLDDALRAKSEPIAIIGLSCRFPGAAERLLPGYWRLVVRTATDGVRPIPPERFDLEADLRCAPRGHGKDLFAVGRPG